MITWLSIWLGPKCPDKCVQNMLHNSQFVKDGDKRVVIAEYQIDDLDITPFENIELRILESVYQDAYMKYLDNMIVEPGSWFTREIALSDFIRFWYAATCPNDVWYHDTDAIGKYIPEVNNQGVHFSGLETGALHPAVFYANNAQKYFGGLVNRIGDEEVVTRRSVFGIINRREVEGNIYRLPDDSYIHDGMSSQKEIRRHGSN